MVELIEELFEVSLSLFSLSLGVTGVLLNGVTRADPLDWPKVPMARTRSVEFNFHLLTFLWAMKAELCSCCF